MTGPPVVLFPSLAGSVLECEESPLEDYVGERIWMNIGSMLGGSTDEFRLEIQDSKASSHIVAHPFVQHLLLDPVNFGQDVPGFKVRAKPGLAGCEYLSEVVGVKGGTVILGVITDMLREHGYTEFDGETGSMIGASYDWRLMPAQLEDRDQFFSRLLEQTEAMVAADPEHRPAVIVGFSLGCRIAKYFLHFCHAKKGEEWMANNITHFVPLGGPFLGAVQLMRAVMVDGAFAPLDVLFTESQLLTILRSVPVGRYLQPISNWEDGLDMPFVFVREQFYVKVSLGALSAELGDEYKVSVVLDGKTGTCKQTCRFHKMYPFTEHVEFGISANLKRANLKILIRDGRGSVLATGKRSLIFEESQHLQESVEASRLTLRDEAFVFLGVMEIETTITSSSLLSSRDLWKETFQGTVMAEMLSRQSLKKCLGYWFENAYGRVRSIVATGADKFAKGDPGADDFSEMSFQSFWSGSEDDEAGQTLIALENQWKYTDWCAGSHPLSQHIGGKQSELQYKCRRATEKVRWTPAHPVALQGFEGLHVVKANSWQVPGPDGFLDDATTAPPVANVTAIYGVNVPTLRTIFLRHRDVLVAGGVVEEVKAPFTLDAEGDVDGLIVYEGQGFETSAVPQVRQDTGSQVFLSGDGTVNYQSLRHAATWKDSCDVTVVELPGCDHRGVSSDERMLELLRGVLGIEEGIKERQLKEYEEIDKAIRQRWGSTIRWCSGWLLLQWVAKSGFRFLNVFRPRFSLIIQVLGVLNLFAALFMLVFGATKEHDLLETMAWARGDVASLDRDVSRFVGFEGAHFKLGLMTYSYRGEPAPTGRKCFRTTDLYLYEHDTTCSALTQRYNLFPYALSGTLYGFGASIIKFNRAGAFFAATLSTIRSPTLAMEMNWYSDFTCSSQLCQRPFISATEVPIYSATQMWGQCVQASVTFGVTTYDFSYRITAQPRQSGWIVLGYTGPRIDVVMPAPVPFSDGVACKSFECINATSATLTAYDQTCSTVSSTQAVALPLFTPQNALFDPTHSDTFVCLNYTDQGEDCADSGVYVECTHSYKACLDLPRNATTPVSPGCWRGMEYEMCESCYSAGVYTYAMTILTAAIQLPLVWLSLLRTSAGSDSRCSKFLTVPLSAFLIVGSCLCHDFWSDQCFSKMSQRMENVVDLYGLEGVASATASKQWGGYLPFFVAGMSFIMLLLNILTPVPELFAYIWTDPLDLPVSKNSGGPTQHCNPLHPDARDVASGYNGDKEKADFEIELQG